MPMPWMLDPVIRIAVGGLLVAALVPTLAGCSSTPAAVHTHAPAPTSTPGAPITGAALEKITAWGECQQLVRKQVKAKPDQVVAFTHQKETSSAAHTWTAVGDASFSSTPAWSYTCALTIDGGNVKSESLTIGVLG